MLTAALVGLPFSGKTTIFRLLTEKAPGGKADLDRAVVPVADPRLQVLSDVYHPKKKTPAQIGFVDVPGLTPGGAGDSRRFLTEIRDVDALIQVLGAFPGTEDTPPDDAAETISLELTFADLEAVEKRLARLAKGKISPAEELEKDALLKSQKALEDGIPIRLATLSKEEAQSLRSMALLTQKPVLYVLNVGEERRDFDVKAFEERHQGALIEASAAIEAEILELPPEERKDFLGSLGFDEPGLDRLTRACYRHLGLISFLTAGEDEVRAWTIPEKTSAKEAAGKIHSDIARGFIRAEVVAYDDFVQNGFSMAAVKEKGHWRLEGKEYIVRDGDIVNFRFNA